METNRDSGVCWGAKSIDHQQCLIQYALLIGVRFVFVPWILKLESTRGNKSADESFGTLQYGLNVCGVRPLRRPWLANTRLSGNFRLKWHLFGVKLGACVLSIYNFCEFYELWENDSDSIICPIEAQSRWQTSSLQLSNAAQSFFLTLYHIQRTL